MYGLESDTIFAMTVLGSHRSSNWSGKFCAKQAWPFFISTIPATRPVRYLDRHNTICQFGRQMIQKY